MPTVRGLVHRLKIIGGALGAPFEKLNSWPRGDAGLFEFLAPLLPDLPSLPVDLAAAVHPDDPGAVVVESSEPEVAHTLYVLARLLRAKRVVEVGVFRGFTSRFLARALADEGGGSLHLVDRSPQALDRARGAAGTVPEVLIHAHLGCSWEANVLAQVPAECDLVYLDADHSEEGVVSELQAWREKLRPEGILAVHDTINISGVCRAINRLAGRTPLLTMATGRGSGLTLIRPGMSSPDRRLLPATQTLSQDGKQ